MNPIIRNFLNIIRRYKLAITLNILGLSVAFAAFMVIMTQVHYDYSYDKFHKDYDKIFQLEFKSNIFDEAVTWGNQFPPPFAQQFIESSPHIISGAIRRWSQTCRFHIEREDGQRHYYEDTKLEVTPSFFELFSFDFVEGAKEDKLTPGTVVIPLSLSRKLFGNEPAVGKHIFHSDWGSQTVRAVYRDFPSNSTIKNILYFAIGDAAMANWNSPSSTSYIRVNDPANVPLIIENFKRSFAPPEDIIITQYDWEVSDIRLTALKDLRFLTDMHFPAAVNKQTLLILFAIAIVIVAIACINFTNFNTALAPKRIKTINTQRIFGADKLSLRISIVFEAVFFSVLSYLIAILVFFWFFSTPLSKLVDAVLVSRQMIIGGTALIALLAGLFAGLYPARFMTSFEPALALKGSFGLSPKGRKIRNILTGIQFIASFALIVGASFIYLQNHFMQNPSSMGFDKDNIITANIGTIKEHREEFVNKLKAHPGIENVTYSHLLLTWGTSGWGLQYKEEQVNFKFLTVHYSFFETMGIENPNQDFRWRNMDMENGVFVFNETAKRTYPNMEINTFIGNREIAGFMPDVKFTSFRREVEPMAFNVTSRESELNQIYFKLKAGANKRSAMSHIHATFDEVATANPYPIEVMFFDEVIQRMYIKEISLNKLITLFSLIAIFISIVGVFGLVVFDGEYRRKEVGIRKALGASTMGIIIMFNKAYIRVLLISFVIAAPLSWYGVNIWLENFVYKTSMYWWVYLLAFVVVGIITVATVTFQNWRVANDDPVNAIKSE